MTETCRILVSSVVSSRMQGSLRSINPNLSDKFGRRQQIDWGGANNNRGQSVSVALTYLMYLPVPLPQLARRLKPCSRLICFHLSWPPVRQNSKRPGWRTKCRHSAVHRCQSVGRQFKNFTSLATLYGTTSNAGQLGSSRYDSDRRAIRKAA